MIESPLLQWARYYTKKFGFSVIPIRADDSKAPTIKWDEYMRRLPTDEELAKWFGAGGVNMAVVTGSISGISVLDDDPRNRRGAASPELAEIVAANPTLEASTPRGGTHFFYLDFDGRPTKSEVLRGVDLKSDGGYVLVCPSKVFGKCYAWRQKIESAILAPFPAHSFNNINIKSFDSYLLGTDASNDRAVPIDTAVPIGTAVLKGVIGGCGGKEGGESQMSQESQESQHERILFKKGTRDNDLFHLANCLVKGGMSINNAMQILRIAINSWNETESEYKQEQWIQNKIQSAIKRSSEKSRCIADLVREIVIVTDLCFTCDTLYRDVTVVTRAEKALVRKTLHRLKQEGIIERVGRGAYRRIEKETRKIEWRNAGGLGEWNLQYPFGLEDLFITRPKNIVMVDGTTDSGKSLFMLHVAYRNAEYYPQKIHYFSSEMAEDELHGRLSLFPEVDRFDNVFFKERSRDFADVIEPDDINIIDYLELSGDDFVDVARMVRDIWAKLDKGICLIARQKNPGALSGRGGQAGWEKARLVVSMDFNTVKIEKCKNWRDRDTRPAGREWKWHLRSGWKFVDEASNAGSEIEY